MQDDTPYHDPGAYVYMTELALEVAAIWHGIDMLERSGVSLDTIARRLSEDWETTVITLAMLGRRRP